MRKILVPIISIVFLVVTASSTLARDPYPNKARIKYMVAPPGAEGANPQTMIMPSGKRSDIISFGCYFDVRPTPYANYLNDIEIDTTEKAAQACKQRWPGYTSVQKPYLKNNKNVLPNEEKYDANGYDWPIGDYLESTTKQPGFMWATPIVYSAQRVPNACGADGNQPCDCIYTPSGPKETWIRLHHRVEDRECVAPPYTTSGPWWDWLLGEIDRTRNGTDINKVISVGMFFGIDGEGRPYKSQDDNWDAGFDLKARFYNEYVPAVVREVQKRYPGKTLRGHTDDFEKQLFLENNIDFHRESLCSDGTGDYLYKGLGNWGWWQGFSNYFWVTKTGGLWQWPPMYQTTLAGLSQHVDLITGFITWPWLYQDGKGDFLKFVGSYIGKDINDTPGVWTYLRETRNTKEIGVNTSGKYGDYDYFLYRAEDLENNKTVPVLASSIPFDNSKTIYNYRWPWYRYQLPTDEGYVGRKNASGNRYMSFDVDDGYRYAGKVSSYDVRVVYLASGSGTFGFQYKDSDNNWVEKTFTKENTGFWQEVSFRIDNALFNNNASEGTNANLYPTDFRLDSKNIATIFHLVEIRGIGDVIVGERPKAQVSCDIVRNIGDNPLEGISSVGLNQNIYVKARLVDPSGNPISGERIMSTYNTEWNLAKSAITDADGVVYIPFNTANRLNSTGFVGAESRTYKFSMYSFQAFYPGNDRFQPSRNDCYVMMSNSSGAGDSMNARMKITGVNESQRDISGKIKISYSILGNNGTVVANGEQWMGRLQSYYVEDPNYQTIPIWWVDESHHVAFNQVTVKGSGKIPVVPTIPPRTPTPSVSIYPTPTITSPSGSPAVSITPTPAFTISLNAGLNEVLWKQEYPRSVKFSEIPDTCNMVETNDNGFWRLFVKNYGGEDLIFASGKNYLVKCSSVAVWKI